MQSLKEKRSGMVIALSIWNNRIAPVFDVARRLRLLTVENSQITAATDVASVEESLQAKVTQLGECKVRILICGAISRELEAMIAGSGIQVIPFTAGEATAVANDWLSGQLLKSDHYLMPGCCRRHKNRCHAGRSSSRTAGTH
jgi:predicted Fe-Mo cluster-binding NifX family protein